MVENAGGKKMYYVLIKLHGGLIKDVSFYYNETGALYELYNFVRNMEPEDDDAAVYGKNGLIKNANQIIKE